MKKSAIIVLINSKKEILLQLRDNKPEIAYPNYWGLIGGGVEENETELEAIKREINEEINCRIEPLKELGKFYASDQKIIITVFFGKIDKKVQEIKLSEGQRVEFFNLEELVDLKMPDPVKNFILKNRDKFYI